METTKLYKEEDLKSAFDAGVRSGKTNHEIYKVGVHEDFDSWNLANRHIIGTKLRTDWLKQHTQNVYSKEVRRMKHLTVFSALSAVSQYTGIEKKKIVSDKLHIGKTPRDAHIVQARSLLFYLCYYHVPLSVSEIGRKIASKHHGTVIAHVKRWTYYVQTEKYARKIISDLYTILRGRGFNMDYYSKQLDAWDLSSIDVSIHEFRLYRNILDLQTKTA